MMLLDNCGGQVNCFTSTKPNGIERFPLKWDSQKALLNNEPIAIHYNQRNSGNYLYFEYNGTWYKTPSMTKSGVSLLHYVGRGNKLFTADWMGDR